MPIHLSKKQTVGWDHISRRLFWPGCGGQIWTDDLRVM